MPQAQINRQSQTASLTSAMRGSVNALADSTSRVSVNGMTMTVGTTQSASKATGMTKADSRRAAGTT